MAEPRKLRIVKRTVVEVAVLLLLLASYVASWGAIRWKHEDSNAWDGKDESRHGWVEELRLDDNLFAPLTLYSQSDLPLADDLRAFHLWCRLGGDLSWETAKACT
jgi:hypothetical protein